MRSLSTALTGAGAGLASWLLARWTLELHAAGASGPDDVVALATSAVGATVAAWYALTALVVVLGELAACSRRLIGLSSALHAAARRFGAPVLRRAATVGVGAGLALGATPAVAAGVSAADFSQVAMTPVADAAGDDDGEVPVDLRPGVLPWSGSGATPEPSTDRRPDGASDEHASDAEPGEPARPAHEDAGATSSSVLQATYVVRPDDTLWDIAAAHLGEDADDSEVADAWPRWHAQNSAVIGTDPDLIHPDQVLLVPEPKDTP